ncbi:LysR family transcriptional regulator [Pseudonocardia sulfidoxydans NBRC 16205]|uniref:LysR family transcriptional regulator n=1 Tax=Pseudonocardia sulfidoxydans NBRC 16205 TaxID=1223511 RepID=A0A511DPD3_9PSEU|nr:LysR family transcriptional regulator [Pseudonocardia sulfidoxydans]GEL26686.1 LysR family transcriptional regulator [Pseudonocardia sulfidoxydans NBRC 16205]
MLDTRRLRIFCTVAEEGSFTAAAARLHFTQSAVSQQMAILEREVGTPLVDRRPRGIRLTPAGTLLAERARSLLNELAGLEQEVQRIGERPAAVHLGVFTTAGAHLVPLVVREYRQRHPDTQLVLHPSQPGELPAQLADGLITVGLSWDYDFAPRPDEGLLHHHLRDDPMCVLLPENHPRAAAPSVRLRDLSDEPWIARDHRAPYADALEVMCRIAGFEPDVVFRTEDYSALQGLVAAGVGVAVAPRLALVAQRPDIVAVPFEDPAFTRRIDAVTLLESARDPLVAALVDVLREVARPQVS